MPAVDDGAEAGPAVNRARLARVRDTAAVALKYLGPRILDRAGLARVLGLEPPGPGEEAPEAEELTRDLEAMGPTFVKLGQILSTRPDLVPPAWIQALARLQDRVEPFSFADVERIVTSELGVRMSRAFQSFEAWPVASASLGQVHRAVLRDGRLVAVKVQRPGIRDGILEDLAALAQVAGVLERHTEFGRRYRLADMVDEVRCTLLDELDYRKEARNLEALGRSMQRFPRLVIPRPVHGYTADRVLTMDYLKGVPVDRIPSLLLPEIDGHGLAEEMFKAYMVQILVEGLYHADPHPGNVLLLEDHRLGLLDMGMVGNLGPTVREQLLKLLISIAEGDGDEASQHAVRLGSLPEGLADEGAFRREATRLVANFHGASLKDLQVGRVLMDMSRLAAEAGLILPRELSLLGKTLMNLDVIGRLLAPDCDPNEWVRRHSTGLVAEMVWHQTSVGRFYSRALEATDFVEELPLRVNRVLDSLAENRLSFRVDAVDEAELMVHLQKIANRITAGLVLAALIVGAALLMAVPTRFQLFGYPGLAILLFLAAAGGGFHLLWTILWSDRKTPSPRRHPS